jgi:hypothetical protein
MKTEATQQLALVQEYRKCMFIFGPSHQENGSNPFLDSD